MRTAGLPNFRKLWGKIETDMDPGTYTITITNSEGGVANSARLLGGELRRREEGGAGADELLGRTEHVPGLLLHRGGRALPRLRHRLPRDLQIYEEVTDPQTTTLL